tara:strand:+ start:3119 stop:3679 length:561 start_codon:yes stop_codon:yes gene_type:complete
MEIKEYNDSLALKEKSEIRDGIMHLENMMKSVDGAYIGDSDRCPLEHYFTAGIYTRKIFIPAGDILVGKIHKHAHPNFLVSGTVEVMTESEGSQTLTGPEFMISEAGTKRTLHAITDLVWITVHANPDDGEDLGIIEKEVIAKDYEEYDKFANKQLEYKEENFLTRIKNRIIKFLRAVSLIINKKR